MRFHLKVIPNASRSEIITEKNGNLKVKVQAPPEDGRANKAVIQLLAQHFKIPKNHIKIIAGEKSHQKIIEVFDLPNENTLNK
ncbi:MAG: DUF167 domain-containing protein [Puniceicoccales bacterium]|jgi:uncharacterized protein (TIGR00251 family)|nr:DUF167 domain-containing protein [Puniceicoccales bacterium]